MTDLSHRNILPALRHRDADAAVEFLGRAFGALQKAIHRGGDGRIAPAELAVGTGLVMLGQYSSDGWMGGEPPRPLASTVSIYVVVSDPDVHHTVAVAGGADIVRELEDAPYSSREYSARDCEWNLWSFGTYDPYTT